MIFGNTPQMIFNIEKYRLIFDNESDDGTSHIDALGKAFLQYCKDLYAKVD